MIEADALALTKLLTLGAVILQSIEMINLRERFSHSGPWAWHVVKSDFEDLPRLAKNAFDFLFRDHRFLYLELTRLLVAIMLISGLVPANAQPPIYTLVLLITLLGSIRFRGTFNGGSDSMIFILISAITVQAWFANNFTVTRGALTYVAIHSIISYAISGFVKLKNPAWRSGLTLQLYLHNSTYDVPKVLKNMISKNVSIIATWLLIIFELGFALILIWPQTAPIFLVTGAAFHLGAFATFGLNRFFFAWMATYPAILWCITS